ncbi:MAG: DUF2946 family protein [Nevskiales bacterium]|nr:DUF2946 family protein [Nevskiales bacterium]
MIRLRRRARRRPRWTAALLSLLLLGQLLLPGVHAQNWARDRGDARLYAFCGVLTPALASQLRAVLPAELATRGSPTTGDHPAGQNGGCSLCSVVHGGHLDAAPPSVALALPAGAAFVAVDASIAVPSLRRQHRPQPRAPPQFS